MIVQFPSSPKPTSNAAPNLKDLGEILHLLSYSLALVASPRLSAEAARTIAKRAQETAESYAVLISACIEQEGSV